MRTTSNVEKPGLSSSSENTLQKMFIGNDRISEIVNVLGSDGGNFSELSDSDTCKVHSPYSSSSSSSSSSCSNSSEEEEIVQPEPDRGRKKTRRALPKWADTNFELGWKEQIQMFQ